MRPIDADELLEHAWREKLDSRESVAKMIENAPTAFKGDLTWVHPKYIPLTSAQNDLFLSYQTGWALQVVYWRTGCGWRRIDTNDPVDPELVAQINLPD